MLSFIQGFAPGMPCSAKENIMATDLVVYLSTCNGLKPVKAYCLHSASSPPSPPLKGENGLACVHVERVCKVQLWISVISFRRDSFADEKVAIIGGVLFACVVCTQVIRLTKCLLGEMNPKRPNCSSPTSFPEKKHWHLRHMGNKTVLHGNQQQCIKYASPK